MNMKKKVSRSLSEIHTEASLKEKVDDITKDKKLSISFTGGQVLVSIKREKKRKGEDRWIYFPF